MSKKRFELNEKKSVTIWDLLSKNDVKVYYLCLAGYKEGIDFLKNKYHNLKIIEAELFEEDDSILSKDNEYWAYYDDKFRDCMIERVVDILKAKGFEEPYTRNLSVMFERNRPSNTVFPLYWIKSEQWAPVKAREG